MNTITIYSPEPMKKEALINAIVRMIKDSHYYTDLNRMQEDMDNGTSFSYQADIDVYPVDIPNTAKNNLNFYATDIRRLVGNGHFIDARQRARELEEYICQYELDEKKKSLLEELKLKASSGMVACVVWGIDCDQAESTSLTHIPATIKAWEELEEHVYENAEGPSQVKMITPAEALIFEPSFRDHAAEAAGY